MAVLPSLSPRAVLAAALLLLGSAAEAQRVPDRSARPLEPQAAPQPARFFGRVLDATTQQPIGGARLSSPAFGGVATTDSLGRFDIAGIPSGIVRIFITAPQFPRANLTLAFASGEQMERILELDSTMTFDADTAARRLPQVTVEAEPLPPVWLRDFERRRTAGRGQYLTRGDIDRRNPARLADVVQTLRGVTLDCGGGGSSCHIRMVRAPMRCYPEYWVDGQLNNAWGPLIPIRDVEALEVYTGPSDTPGEFSGARSGCGTIVIWTSAGPRRRDP